MLVHEAFSLLVLHSLNAAALQAVLARCTAALSIVARQMTAKSALRS